MEEIFLASGRGEVIADVINILAFKVQRRFRSNVDASDKRNN